MVAGRDRANERGAEQWCGGCLADSGNVAKGTYEIIDRNSILPEKQKRTQ